MIKSQNFKQLVAKDCSTNYINLVDSGNSGYYYPLLVKGMLTEALLLSIPITMSRGRWRTNTFPKCRIFSFPSDSLLACPHSLRLICNSFSS